MTSEMHLLGESIQEVTLYAWPMLFLYGDNNRFDEDSRQLLEMMRDWAEEFEQWWAGNIEKDATFLEVHDYVEDIEAFTDRKCKEYIKNFT